MLAKPLTHYLRNHRYYLRHELVEPLLAGSWWHPRYFEWAAERRKMPALQGRMNQAIMRANRFSPFALKFLKEGYTHLVDHDLTPDSLVVDVGSYTGEWAREIYTRYQPRIIGFEPAPRFCREMIQAFANEPKVAAYQYGLSNANRKVWMEMCAWGTSEFSTGRGDDKIQVEMKDVVAVFEELQIEEVDLLKVNIEGGEYPLLERMLECGLISRCKKIMVQFHKYDVVQSAKQAEQWREKLVKQIERTHSSAFSFPFVWEGWVRRQLAPGKAQ